MKLTSAQQAARIEILRTVANCGGSAMWSQLHSKGHHYMQVSAAALRGDLRRIGAYCFSLTDAGRFALSEAEEGR